MTASSSSLELSGDESDAESTTITSPTFRYSIRTQSSVLCASESVQTIARLKFYETGRPSDYSIKQTYMLLPDEKVKLVNLLAGAGIFGYDPRVLQQVQREDQYILPEGQAHKRGRFEMAFTQIGGGCLSGGILGGTLGMRSGMQYVSGKELPKTLMYSIFGVVVECRYSPLSQFENDDLNSVTAGTLTGLLFKCTDKYAVK
ncbi:TIM23-like protein [Mya arenaria]|uniref:TIM23-like protein n=1 Tax=Mya arenaria TaxID=6604 RepID=A0ABY7DGD8_MYAAR|nr:TIM23-like protein [Mya arenaria]